MIGQLISFAFFVAFCMKYIWPAFTQAMTEREKKIADGLNAADRAETKLAEAQEKIEADLLDAKKRAADILEQANKRANQIIEEAKNDAKTEAGKVALAAKAEIEHDKNRLREELRKQVAKLSVVGAEKILQKSVDESVHADMLNKLAAEL